MSILNVNKINPVGGGSTITISGIASVTGSITATDVTAAHHGDGSNLTGIPAGQLTGTVADARLSTVSSSKLSGALPALDGSALTGVGIGTDGSVNTSGIVTATTLNYTGNQNLSHRNIIINGDMRIAQRASSSTANGYGDLDRWKHEYAGTNENPTFAQVSLTTSDTPYTLGLTKTYKLTNGNQTSGLQASSQINFNQQIEAQNIRNSGWDYTSSSSYITLSFWVRSSVSQNFNGFVKTSDGSMYIYPYETGTLSANTWTKITKSIPGNSNLQIDDDNANGFQVFPIAIYGTNLTDNSVTYNQWAGWASGSRSKDQANSWFTTNDATLEITGVQLEVGPVATPFEHLSFAENKRRCGRYCQRSRFQSFTLVGTPSTYYFSRTEVPLTVPMRGAVTGTIKQATWLSNRYFAYKTWSSQTNVTTLTSASFASSHMGGSSASLDDSSKTDVNSVTVSMTVASGSSNAPLPANGPGSNNVFPIEVYDCLLEAEI